jgi:hypothetical protein
VGQPENIIHQLRQREQRRPGIETVAARQAELVHLAPKRAAGLEHRDGVAGYGQAHRRSQPGYARADNGNRLFGGDGR